MDPARLREMLAGAPVVASTTATWSSEHYDGAGAPLAFDLAVVDEASQLTVPALVGALRFARRFVLVGDERQLPPLVVSPEAAAGGLGRSLFAELLARWGAGASVALDQQYRMHPMICAFPSREFYDGHLVTAGSARDAALAIAAEERPAAPFDPARPVVFLDVGGEARTSRPSGAPGGEKASRAQAEVAARVVLGLRARGVDAAGIGVVAPYRAQVAAIRQRLAAAGETGVVVDTVDRFQGGEREVVVLAFGPDPLRMAHRAGAMVGTIAGATPFVADAHRLNVALTRARSKLILIGDRAALARVPVLGRLVEYCAGLYGGRGGIARVGDARVNDPEGTGNGSQRGREERREEEDREREAPRGPGGARVRR